MKDDLRAAILGSDDLPREPVDVPWDLGGEKLYIRGLTGDEKDAWMARMMPAGELKWAEGATADLVVRTLVDEDGERVFSNGDAKALGSKGAAILSPLFDKALRLSGLSEDTEQELDRLAPSQDALSASG